MKYNELNLNRKILGDQYIVYDWVEDDDSITIFAKSQTPSSTCPDCGSISHDKHATYHRTIQMVPIRLKTTYVDINAYKYNCDKPECSRKTFMEPLSFASFYQTRSDELTSLILAVSLFLSNEGASNVLGLIGIKVSNDTIKRIYDRIVIEDDVDIETVGIDDVAIRKGQTYATAVYDMKTHHMLALLDGRDAETLKTWLKDHTKIKKVARDRASAYASAINEILPECIQVADRFHLLQNLIDKMREIFKEELPKKIFIKDNEIIDASQVEKERKPIIPVDSPVLDTLSYDNTAPLDENGEPIIYDNKLRDLSSKQYIEQAKSRKKNSN